MSAPMARQLVVELPVNAKGASTLVLTRTNPMRSNFPTTAFTTVPVCAHKIQTPPSTHLSLYAEMPETRCGDAYRCRFAPDSDTHTHTRRCQETALCCIHSPSPCYMHYICDIDTAEPTSSVPRYRHTVEPTSSVPPPPSSLTFRNVLFFFLCHKKNRRLAHDGHVWRGHLLDQGRVRKIEGKKPATYRMMKCECSM